LDFFIFMYAIQHCFICLHSDSAVSEDAGIEPRNLICRPFKEPRNRFPALQAGTTTLFVVTARQATLADGIDSSKSIPRLHKRFQKQALDCCNFGIASQML
jgi:hypothetical protein